MEPKPAAISQLFPAESESARDTRQFGKRLALMLPAGTVLALQGDLGAGKTELVRGLVAGLGGDPADVTSPTFTVVQQYDVPSGLVIHVDAYRSESPAEFVEMGLADYLDEAVLAAIEWPDQLGPHLPADSVVIRIAHAGDTKRLITLESPEGRS
ncbi:MAG: tRNA threonylcarbamoyladenosine biosynthesis protein TsaE [Rhodothermales bacterium]|jgi:tRNA threonylcarbamoyladenosine biosynthesis protein TsaE